MTHEGWHAVEQRSPTIYTYKVINYKKKITLLSEYLYETVSNNLHFPVKTF